MKIFSQMKTKTQFHVKNKSVIPSWGETIVQLGNLEKLWATKRRVIGQFFLRSWAICEELWGTFYGPFGHTY